jgi:SAM-dependent methyltransferase
MSVPRATSCRVCGQPGLQPVLSLGSLPLANALLEEAHLGQPEPRYPLDVAFCAACSLVQLTDSVPAEQIFREYAYFSSVSQTMLRSVDRLVARLADERGLGSRHLVVEIGSNDGYLLQFYKQRGIPVLGIEPAVNVARVAQAERGIPTRAEFFSASLARDLLAAGQAADVVHAHNVLAHVADPNDVVRGLHLLLRDDGVVVVEVPYVRDLVERGEFDTIYHEHLCYFSLTALAHLFHRHGLAVQAVERISIHGGSLRVCVGKTPDQDESVSRLLLEERALGLDEVDYYRQLGEKAATAQRSLRSMLLDLKRQGHSLAAYGAAAKGATLLAYCGLGGDVLDYVVDRNAYKQGKYVPGARVAICAPEKLLQTQPDYLLVLAWNIADEVMEQQAEYRRRGGRFILPIPCARIVD